MKTSTVHVKYAVPQVIFSLIRRLAQVQPLPSRVGAINSVFLMLGPHRTIAPGFCKAPPIVKPPSDFLVAQWAGLSFLGSSYLMTKSNMFPRIDRRF